MAAETAQMASHLIGSAELVSLSLDKHCEQRSFSLIKVVLLDIEHELSVNHEFLSVESAAWGAP